MGNLQALEEPQVKTTSFLASVRTVSWACRAPHSSVSETQLHGRAIDQQHLDVMAAAASDVSAFVIEVAGVSARAAAALACTPPFKLT